MPWTIIVTVVFKLLDFLLTRAEKKGRREITDRELEKIVRKHGRSVKDA